MSWTVVCLLFMFIIFLILSRPFVLVISMMLDMRCYFAQFSLYIKSWYVIVFVLDTVHLLYYYYLLLLMISHGELAIFIYIMLHIINMDDIFGLSLFAIFSIFLCVRFLVSLVIHITLYCYYSFSMRLFLLIIIFVCHEFSLSEIHCVGSVTSPSNLIICLVCC